MPGRHSNRHLRFGVGFRDKFRDNFGTRELQVKTSLKTPNVIRDTSLKCLLTCAPEVVVADGLHLGVGGALTLGVVPVVLCAELAEGDGLEDPRDGGVVGHVVHCVPLHVADAGELFGYWWLIVEVFGLVNVDKCLNVRLTSQLS